MTHPNHQRQERAHVALLDLVGIGASLEEIQRRLVDGDLDVA